MKSAMYDYWDEYEWLHHAGGDEEAERNGCIGPILFVLVFWAFLFLCILFGGCKSVKYVTVPITHTDTLIIAKHQRDSIYLRDSTHVSEQQHGDTILLKITKWRTEYRDREVHDTLYQSKTDTIPQPYPVEVKVDKPLTWWQKTRIHCGELLLVILVIYVVYSIYKFKKKIFI